MPDGEVKIHISADSDSKGIADVQSKIGGLKNSAKDLGNAFANMGGGIADNLYKSLIEKLKKGDLTEAGAPSRILKKLKPLFDAGTIKSADDIRKWVQNGEKTDAEYSAQFGKKNTNASTVQKPPLASRSIPAQKPVAAQKPIPSKQEDSGGEYQTASEANQRPRRPVRQFRQLTEDELAENRKLAAIEEAKLKASIKHAASEKSVTNALKEQTALRKAGISLSPRGISRAVGVGEQVLSGGNPASSASSLLMNLAGSSKNPLVIAAASIAAIGATIASVRTDEGFKDSMRDLKQGERMANNRFDLNRASGVFGSSGALVSKALSAEQEIAQRENAKAGLAKKAKFQWNAPSTWEWGGLRKNEGHREQEENDNAIMAARVAKASAEKRAAALFEQTEGGLELDALRQRSKRTLAGSRAAFVDDEARKAGAKYREVVASAGDTEKGRAMAKEMATLTYQNDLRDRQANAGAGLVDSHSGGAGIAAAARWAMQGTPQSSEIGSKLETLIGVVSRGNQENQIIPHHK